MNMHPQMTAAAEQAARVVDNVSTSQFADPTPCTEWDVRTLLNHLLLWTAYSMERRARDEPVPDELMSKDFAAEPDFAARYRAQLDRALDAWADPAAWERDLNVMGSKMPASEVAAMLLAEIVLHGWDLAAATGQRYECPDDVAETVLPVVSGMAEMFRQYKGFADSVTIDAGNASAFEQALAISGRDPRWQRP